MRTLTLSSCLLLSSVLAAQGGDEKPPKSKPLPNQTTKKNAGEQNKGVTPGGVGFQKVGPLGDGGNPLGSGDLAGLRAAEDQLVGAVPTGDAATTLAGDHLFTPMVSVKPRRLAPGQLGNLFVVVTLGRGGHVVLPGGIAELRLSPDAGPFEFGQPTLDAAGKGRLAGKFKGQPVHDDTLLFRVPVTVRPDAEKKQHLVAGVVRLELVDGMSGRTVGVFESQLQGMIAVGEPLASALLSKTAGPRDVVGGSEAARSTSRTAGRGAPSATGPKNRVAHNGELESPTEVMNPSESSADEPGGVRGTVFDLLWLAFGGVVVLVMIILMVRRK